MVSVDHGDTGAVTLFVVSVSSGDRFGWVLIFQIKNSFLFLSKAVKSHKKSAFWSIYCILSLLKIYGFY